MISITTRRSVGVALLGAAALLTACRRQPDIGVAPTASVERVAFDASPTQSTVPRTIVRHAGLEIGVRDVDTARVHASAIAARIGGLVENEAVRERSADMRLRVPEARLEEALDSLATLGDVRHRQVTMDDRSAEAADLDARVRNLQTSRDRLRALHDRATTVAEVVQVERELARVQGELDGLQAQLAYLRSQAAMSTITLSLGQARVLGPLGLVGQGLGWVIGKLFIWK